MTKRKRVPSRPAPRAADVAFGAEAMLMHHAAFDEGHRVRAARAREELAIAGHVDLANDVGLPSCAWIAPRGAGRGHLAEDPPFRVALDLRARQIGPHLAETRAPDVRDPCLLHPRVRTRGVRDRELASPLALV